MRTARRGDRVRRPWRARCTRVRAMRELPLAVVIAAGACAGGAQSPTPAGPVARALEVAATEAGVPVDLLTAVAIEERGIALPAVRLAHDDQVRFAGMLELRRGKLDTLALGARLVGATEQAIQIDTELGTRAGALVLASLGATADPATWRPALEQLSG